MFIDFANFYQCFIQGFNKIDTLFTFLLKTIELSNLALKIFIIDDNEIVNNNNSRINEMVVNLSKNNKSKNLIYIPNIGTIGEFIFFNLQY